MSEKTILVIDDSATIRRLVDSELGTAGYRVALAENAEIGIDKALHEHPDLILLDHQLPGTTGYEVCCRLLEDPQLRTIPVVVSSTLRKKAYVEYTDCANVVDMLPKPYTGDLLRTTVANALDTAHLIVQSQSKGTAVPEVIEAHADADLSGRLGALRVREVIDFLNNGDQQGVLEFEGERERIRVHLGQGRIQAVTASGIDPSEIAESLPSAVSDLAPMIKFTLGGRQNSQIEGLVELLDNKVLDARLLRQLLRHQAAVLILRSFRRTPKSFRFQAGEPPPTLYKKLPLDVSLVSLLVEGSLLLPENGVDNDPQLVLARQTLRGQNLDRAGLSGLQMKVLSLINQPITLGELASQTATDPATLRSMLRGFELAELIASQKREEHAHVLALCTDPNSVQRMNQFLARHARTLAGRVVRDALAVKLLLRRNKPDWLWVDLEQAESVALWRQVESEFGPQLAAARRLGLGRENPEVTGGGRFEAFVGWDDVENGLLAALRGGSEPAPHRAAETADCA